MKYQLHPEAAAEHEEQAAYYKIRSTSLGQRYHDAFKLAAARACKAPRRYRTVAASGVRRLSLQGFPFAIYFFEFGGVLQIVAVAPHRKRPGYWLSRFADLAGSVHGPGDLSVNPHYMKGYGRPAR